MAKSGKKGFERIIAAFYNALEGIRSTFQTEAAFRQEFVVAAIMGVISLFLDITSLERAVLLASLVLVLLVELINTAIEAVADKISPEYDELIKKAKDAGAAAVLMSLVIAGIVWGSVLFL